VSAVEPVGPMQTRSTLRPEAGLQAPAHGVRPVGWRQPRRSPGRDAAGALERGIAPDLLVGISAGALNAAFVASRPQTAATIRELGRVWRNLEREDITP
jgi:hypothetical protein